MSELERNLNRLLARLDHMGLRVEAVVTRALRAAVDRDLDAANAVDEADALIDREEVEIEAQCIRQLALFQPTAIDLRKICFVIKVNNDLERIADIAVAVARRTRFVVEHDLSLPRYPGYAELADATADMLTGTVQMLNSRQVEKARSVIGLRRPVKDAYKQFMRIVLDRERVNPDGVDRALTLTLLARSLERIVELCTNVAEDVIFLETGEIVRHSGIVREITQHAGTS